MPYSAFTSVTQVKKAFGLTLQEGGRFIPQNLPQIIPDPILIGFLNKTLTLATVTGSEKARSELLVAPILVEVREILDRQVALFSGEEFTVDASVGLNGICDFLMSRSPELYAIESPVIALVEAKKADLKLRVPQCIAEMVAADRFNTENNGEVKTVYGCVTSGTLWRFLKLEGTVATIDLAEYPLEPIGQLLAMLVWMVKEG
ncbi:MAG: hypothetical protein HC857_16695 [Synechococcales cyanobacterium RU_4_20]|nr:hypothetical protein [Synechococcales cyanobacterium RU_4_20]